MEEQKTQYSDGCIAAKCLLFSKIQILLKLDKSSAVYSKKKREEKNLYAGQNGTPSKPQRKFALHFNYMFFVMILHTVKCCLITVIRRK